MAQRQKTPNIRRHRIKSVPCTVKQCTGYSRFLLALIFLVASHCLTAGEKEFERLTFPVLSPTLAELNTGSKQTPTLLYHLPKNYTKTEKTFPVFVYLGGGDGSNQIGAINRGIAITKDKDYIIVTLPLYRNTSKLNKDALYGDLMIDADDFPTISKAYRTMLSRFFVTVPNAAKTNNVMGGFSNGGHTTAVLVSGMDDFILDHFSRFILIDGGNTLSSLQRNRLKKCRFLALYGDTEDHWERPIVIRQFQNMKSFADAVNIPFQLVPMKGIGHQFPKQYEAVITKWLTEVAR